ncbi:hypothetical protein PQE70_gp183 [Bacillus phage vB_BanS_Nate]|uniref:Uncharacterized protein n=1 Tax=Bacillus phage vB_BanS_Nate TaxID=2894788 RepID=A0AAE8YV04_9CAUD|nr:hypothetical protein PQE70_gp183 [Bacillus phage vB_BanS_Nate]UGO51036.1 hypothetical protein NATE_183 [Bacillus phage vB_BanS_Nate]
MIMMRNTKVVSDTSKVGFEAKLGMTINDFQKAGLKVKIDFTVTSRESYPTTEYHALVLGYDKDDSVG